MPMVSSRRASDFASGFVQLNLQDQSRPAGGGSPIGTPWHGNAVASAAAATVGNGLGAAGSGGTIAIPLFFQCDYSKGQALEAARICAAWGVDVLNMSFGFWGEAELEVGGPVGPHVSVASTTRV